ncbi:Ubiquinol-cytochrome C reductase QcrB [Mycobacterium tuberculosis]|nr:Ubiquinol-cytochrome C reductase QcrB [Mycobacterium tuberculosis]
MELHQPLNPVPLEYAGAPIPKRMNKLGLGGRPGSGGFLFPDPAAEDAALSQAEHEAERRALTALRVAGR